MNESILKNKLKVLRAERNITQDMLADAIGVTRKTINTIETGKFIPTTVTALKIAAFFNVKIEDVFYLDGSEMCGVCRIVNLRNGKTLLFPSINTQTSLDQHLKELRKGTHKNSALQKDWNEFGPENFMSDIATVLKKNDLTGDIDSDLQKLANQLIDSSTIKNYY